MLSMSILPHISSRHFINEARLSCIGITHVYNHNLRRLYSLSLVSFTLRRSVRMSSTKASGNSLSIADHLSASKNQYPIISWIRARHFPFPRKLFGKKLRVKKRKENYGERKGERSSECSKQFVSRPSFFFLFTMEHDTAMESSTYARRKRSIQLIRAKVHDHFYKKFLGKRTIR